MKRILWITPIVLACSVWSGIARAQGAASQPITQPAAPPRTPPVVPLAMRVVSPEVSPDRHIVFRILAPEAKVVGLRASDIQGLPREGPAFSKDDGGVWSATVGPIDPGAYRYTFVVDGVPTMDPRNPAVSESNTNDWSLVYVPGAAFMDTATVPHGEVASVTYYSKALPMIVVRPAVHTSANPPMPGAARPTRDEFAEDFMDDIVPFVQQHYRTLTDRTHVAIAGLSMGGGQTLNISMSHLDRFGYIGVFSAGVFSFGRAGPPSPAPPPEWEEQRAGMLDDASLKAGLKVLWFGTGTDDRLIPTTKATMEMLKKHGFTPFFRESAGGHTWINWRNYLNEFAPQLFQ